MTTRNDERFNDFIDQMLLGDQQLSDLSTASICELMDILDAQLQDIAWKGVDINNQHDMARDSWMEYKDWVQYGLFGEDEWEE
jgi:hypothetical protein